MKPEDEQLNRLMKAAARMEKPATGDAAFGLEGRVLAHWRGALQNESGGEFLVAWFRRATICAAILAVASLAWNYHSISDRSSVELVADSAMGIGVEP
jgi:hypothetical protein